MVERAVQFIACIPITSDKRWPGLRVKEIEARLDRLQTDRELHSELRERLDATACIHFMSMSVVWNGEANEQAYLIVDITGDGKREAVVEALVKHAGMALLPLFEGSPGITSPLDLRRYLNDWMIVGVAHPFPIIRPYSTGLRFTGTPCLTVKQILEDDRIERAARILVQKALSDAATKAVDSSFEVATSEFFSFVDSGVQSKGARPLDVLAFVHGRLEAKGLLPKRDSKTAAPGRLRRETLVMALLTLPFKSWIFQGAGLLVLAAFVFLMADLLPVDEEWSILELVLRPLVTVWVSAVIVVSMMAVLIGAAFGLVAWRVRHHEDKAKPVDRDPDPDLVREILRRESRPCAPGVPRVSSHLTSVSTIKSEFALSRIALPFAFHVVEFLSQASVFRPGFLSNIGTIHFAQWVRIPGNKLLFLSNYDGSFESYLEDFITKAARGLTSIWSNTQDFPRTQWLFLNGAEDGDRFKRWVRRQQIPTLFWYAAYPALTVDQIRNNVDIREGLLKAAGTTDAEEWVARFGSAPRPRYAVEAPEIQTLAYSGLGDLAEGACLLLRFPDAPGRANDWLKTIQGQVSFGERPEKDGRAFETFVALTWTGLQRLGLSRGTDKGGAALTAEFPSPFVVGMNHPSRNNALGDVGVSAPEHWQWGKCGEEVDAALLIYARDGKIAGAVDAERLKLSSFGVNCVREIKFQPQPICKVKREPFGFADGISQPKVRGLSRGLTPGNGADVLETGEFILGYPDGRNYYPATPQVKAQADHGRWLPSLPQDFVAFSDEAPDQNVRDLGRNGSFLVIRQLKQDKKAFDDWLDTAANDLKKAVPEVPDVREWLAAKLVGRWKNGASLLRHPYKAPPGDYQPDDGFMFGREDPQGLSCPLGAHARRANPRDSFDPDDPLQVGITNRHRILRRGRPYLGADGVTADGLLFMCLNADIERQFEFVQQTWLHSSSFPGLRDESDPFTSHPRDGGTFTIPLPTGPLRVPGLKSFVTVEGGAYFFLPSRRALGFLGSLAGSGLTAVFGGGNYPAPVIKITGNQPVS